MGDKRSQVWSGDISVAALSDVGKVRQHNEDNFVLLPEQGVFIVSDGMGGQHAGALASKVIVNVLPQMIQRNVEVIQDKQDEAVSQALRETIAKLSQQLWQQASTQAGMKGMGATVALAYFHHDKLFVAHMGDSRAYLYHDGKLQQLTDDHSVVSLLLSSRQITPEEARTHPARSMLSRYVGMEDLVYPDVRIVDYSVGDVLLLCTDGLTGMVGNETIEKILAEKYDPQTTCQHLLEAANKAGGRDDITVIVSQLKEGPI